jgi:tubulin-specific chaperone E
MSNSGVNEIMTEKQQDIPRTIDIYRLKGIVGRLFGLRPLGCTLVWETGEWDPVKGEEDGGWSCDEEEEEEESKAKTEAPKPEPKQKKGKWTRREIELVDGTHDIGFWIEGHEARVRVELR